jgi:hypothetical protein
LEIRSEKARMSWDGKGRHERDYDLTLFLINSTSRVRSVEHIRADGNRLAYAGLSYVLRFSDGAVFELETTSSGRSAPWHHTPVMHRNLVVPAGGYLHDVYNLQGTMSSHDTLAQIYRFKRLFWENKGRFCLTAVAGMQGLQSNTIRYNDCPAPPEGYCPLKLSRFTPEGKRKAEKEEGRELTLDEKRRRAQEERREEALWRRARAQGAPP